MYRCIAIHQVDVSRYINPLTPRAGKRYIKIVMYSHPNLELRCECELDIVVIASRYIIPTPPTSYSHPKLHSHLHSHPNKAAIHRDTSYTFTRTWGHSGVFYTSKADVKLMYSLMYSDTPIHGDTSNLMYHPGSAPGVSRKWSDRTDGRDERP